MTFRRLNTWLWGFALLGAGVAIVSAQQAQASRGRTAPIDKTKLRAQIIQLRTEVEMARFDYDYARDDLLENLKIVKGLKMTFGMLGSVSIASNSETAGAKLSADEAVQKAAEDQKKVREAEQTAEEQEKKDKAEVAEIIAKYKPELVRLFTLLSEKRMDLEDAERQYRDAP